MTSGPELSQGDDGGIGGIGVVGIASDVGSRFAGFLVREDLGGMLSVVNN